MVIEESFCLRNVRSSILAESKRTGMQRLSPAFGVGIVINFGPIEPGGEAVATAEDSQRDMYFECGKQFLFCFFSCFFYIFSTSKVCSCILLSVLFNACFNKKRSIRKNRMSTKNTILGGFKDISQFGGAFLVLSAFWGAASACEWSSSEMSGIHRSRLWRKGVQPQTTFLHHCI